MSRKLLTILTLVLAACGARSPEERLEYARLERDRGQLARAAATFARVAADLPDRTDVRVELAEVELRRGDGKAARRAAGEALALDPRDPRAHEVRIRSLAGEERYLEALLAGEEYLAVASAPVRALTALGAVRKDEAGTLLRALHRASRLRPEVRDEPRLLFALGRGDLAGARALLVRWGVPAALVATLDRAAAARRAANEYAGRAVAADPEHAAAHALAGELALLDGRPDAAVNALRRAAVEDDPSALRLLVSACGALGDESGALAAATRAVDRDPGDTSVRLARALLRVRTGDLPGALADADSLDGGGRRTVLGDYVRGVVLVRRGQYEEAQIRLARAAMLPGDPGPRYWLGLALLARGRRRLAAESLKAALEIQPNYGPAHLALSEVMLADGRAGEALLHATRATEIEPGSAAAWTALRRVALARASEPEEGARRERELLEVAECASRKRTELEGGAADWVQLGIVRVRLGDAEGAHAAFDRARELAPDGEEPWLGLAGIARVRGDVAGAERILLRLARLAETSGDDETAARRYEEVLAENGRSVTAANNLAMILLDRGTDVARARDLAARAVVASGRSAATLDTLARAELEAGRRDRAIELLREAEGKAPGHPEIALRLRAAGAGSR